MDDGADVSTKVAKTVIRSFVEMTARDHLTRLLLPMGLLLAMIWQRTRYERELTLNLARADSMLSAARTDLTWHDSLPQAGSRLPSRFVSSADGDTTSLSKLAKRYRYLYFYRSDCTPCEILAQAWTSAIAAKRDSIAFISYSNKAQLKAPAGRNQFVWLATPDDGAPPVLAVPTLWVTDGDDRIVGAAHASLWRVRDLLDMYQVIPAARVDSIYRAFVAARNLGAQPAWIP